MTAAGALLVSGLMCVAAHAQPTFTRDVLHILQDNCQVCHRAQGANLGGMIAPMALTTYAETRPWAKAIAAKVAAREMPPWFASPEQHKIFENERTLTKAQIDTLVAWSAGGAPEGDPADAPAPKAWPAASDWLIGEPDLILKPDTPYSLSDDAKDVYAYLTTTMTGAILPADRVIRAVEIRPGSAAVHHIVAPPLGALTPGNEPSIYAEGVGVLLKRGENITWQMHYHKEPGPGTGVRDESLAAIRFYPAGMPVKYLVQGNDLGRYDFVIPPGAPDYSVTAEYTFQHDTQIVSFMPHLHLRGKSATYEAVYPDGSRETLLRVPRYDFNWQSTYQYREFKRVPKGTKVMYTATWDNTAQNKFNPDPLQTVRWGEPTTDEMSYGYMSFIDDSGDQRSFFDEANGRNGINFVILVALNDRDRDGRMSEAEAPSRLPVFFHVVDADNDGFIDMNEARLATEAMRIQN